MSEPQYAQLPDGRRLAYQEYGDPNGSPVFFFHGWLGSRLDFAPNDELAAPWERGSSQSTDPDAASRTSNTIAGYWIGHKTSLRLRMRWVSRSSQFVVTRLADRTLQPAPINSPTGSRPLRLSPASLRCRSTVQLGGCRRLCVRSSGWVVASRSSPGRTCLSWRGWPTSPTRLRKGSVRN